ncbi:MAG: FAD-dependent oxidoreductase [Desulfitobacterium hafniense]|nr:FAD-dependent oxidoreductase [Desulfitobacterium hafniense]
MTSIYRGDYDVVVCGGGTAGTLAAISAARNGAKTLLVEKGSFLGGVSVTGFFPHSFYANSGKKAVGGIPQEIIDELTKLDGTLGHLRYEGGHLYTHTPVDNEILKSVLIQMVVDAGVDLMLNSLIQDISMQGSYIRSLVIRTKAKTFTVNAKTVIDATGDGDVAHMTGAPFNQGRQDGKMQPVTLIMRITNIDWDKLVNGVPTETPILWAEKPRSTAKTPAYFRGILTQWEDTEEYNQLFTDKNHQLFCLSPWATEATVNTTRLIGVDGTDYDDVNTAEIKSRKQVLETYRFLLKYVPGFANSNLVAGHSLGVRETRRFIGDYELTEEDVLAGRKFEDNIGLGAYPIDMHDPNGGNVTFKQIGDDGSYGIPYRCLLPQGVENLLIAGRCLSATHKALASVRSIAACMVMGQATGLAAAMASKDNKTMREVDIKVLQATLREQGAILE